MKNTTRKECIPILHFFSLVRNDAFHVNITILCRLAEAIEQESQKGSLLQNLEAMNIDPKGFDYTAYMHPDITSALITDPSSFTKNTSQVESTLNNAPCREKRWKTGTYMWASTQIHAMFIGMQNMPSSQDHAKGSFGLCLKCIKYWTVYLRSIAYINSVWNWVLRFIHMNNLSGLNKKVIHILVIISSTILRVSPCSGLTKL